MGKLHRRFPNASLHYIGDCRNLPYNIHPPEWIAQKAQRLVDFSLKQKVRELVIACHTISTLLPRLDTENLQVHDIISTTLKYLKASWEKGKHSLFIGPRTTIESGCYSPSYSQPEMASYLSAVELATRIDGRTLRSKP